MIVVTPNSLHIFGLVKQYMQFLIYGPNLKAIMHIPGLLLQVEDHLKFHGKLLHYEKNLKTISVHSE